MKIGKLSALAGAVLAISAMGFSTSALADATTVTGAAANLQAVTHLNFSIVIPRTLSFRVGTNTAGTIDTITFSPTAAQLGNSTAVAGTGGDLTAGVVTARVIGNAPGAISVKATTTGALSNGAGATIPWTQITAAATALTSPTAILATPSLSTGASVTLPAPAAGATTNIDAKWTYGYSNTTVPVAGTYGGTVANNGQVTYTATMP